MNAVLRWIDRLPLHWVALLAAWLAVAPVLPEPHLVEKLRMLWQHTLVRPLDMFDLVMHATPLALLTTKLWRLYRGTAHNQAEPNNAPPPPT